MWGGGGWEGRLGGGVQVGQFGVVRGGGGAQAPLTSPSAPPYVWPVGVDPWQQSWPGGQRGGGGGESRTRTEETAPPVGDTQPTRVGRLSPHAMNSRRVPDGTGAGGGGGGISWGDSSAGKIPEGENFATPAKPKAHTCPTHTLHCQSPQISPREHFLNDENFS